MFGVTCGESLISPRDHSHVVATFLDVPTPLRHVRIAPVTTTPGSTRVFFVGRCILFFSKNLAHKIILLDVNFPFISNLFTKRLY